MPKCNARDDWFFKDDMQGYKVSDWGRKTDCSSEIFCSICICTVDVKKGFQSLTQHASTKKHKQNAHIKLNIKQLILTTSTTTTIENNSRIEDTLVEKNSKSSTFSTVHLYSISDQSVVAELIWALKVVSSNYSFSSSDGIVEVFQTMFPNAIPKGFSMSRSKLTYLITDALGPYFREELIKDIANEYFSIIYDETTNSGGNKELQVLIRYYSTSKCKIITQHLQTMFIGKATADILSEKIVSAVENANLSLTKLLMLGSDGPNVNKKVARLINDQILHCRSKNLINIGTCSIHTIHNAFLKGIDKFGENAEQLIISIYYYFKGWPTRWEEFETILDKLKLPIRRFIKHVPSRWLTLHDSANRVLENWSAVEYYFLKFIPQHKSSVLPTNSYKKIREFLLIITIKCEVIFIQSSAKIFIKYTGTMQKSEPLVHVMYTELHSLLCTLVGRICKTEYIPKSFFNTKVDDLLTVEKMVAVKDIVVNNLIQEEFKEKKMVGKDILFFLKNVQQHYIAAFKHVLETSPIQNSFLKHLRCLEPLERLKSRSCNSILKLSNDLPFDVDDEILLDEWKLLQLDKDEKESDLNRIDIYWKQFFEKKNSTNSLKYPNVTKIVKSCLSLVHGSADVERNFSISGKMLTDERACMNERTLNALLVTKDSLNHYQNKPQLVLMTKKLITMAKGAHKHYQNYLEEQKKIKHQKSEDKKLEIQIMKQLEETQNKVKENQQEIQEKEKLLKIAREKETQKRGVANKLFEEANKRLKKAILENNIQEAELAHAMLEGVNTVKKEEEQKKKTADALQIQLEKKKASLIQHLSSAK